MGTAQQPIPIPEAAQSQFDELFKLKHELCFALLPHCNIDLRNGVWTRQKSKNSKKKACQKQLVAYMNASPGFFNRMFAEIDAMKDSAQIQGNWLDANFVRAFCAELTKLIGHANVLLSHSKRYAGKDCYGGISELAKL